MSFRISLRLATALGLGGLLVAAAACYDKSDYSPTDQFVDQILTLSTASGATSLPADGFSRLQLVAQLLGSPAFDKRVVVFSTTNGTLDGGQAVANCTGCQQVEADGNGRAVIDLVSSQRIGNAVVTASPQSAPGIAVQMTISFGAAQPDGIIQFVQAPSRAPADGATLSTYTVQVSPSIPQAAQTVTFTTTNGTFAPSGGTSISVPVDAGNLASADLRSPNQIGTGRVLATINGVTQEVAVSFERALPNAIAVSANPSSVPAADASTVTITASLLRNIGSVSDGTLVTFRAVRADGMPVGRFTNITRTTSGTATAVFFPGAGAAGLVTVFVRAEGTNVTGSVEVELTAP